jgi:hypothetical protein
LLTNQSNGDDIDVFESASSTDKNLTTLVAGEIILGTIISIDALGQAKVDFPQNPGSEAIPAISALSLKGSHVSRQVALLFNQGDLSQPIITGLIHSPLQTMLDNFEQSPEATDFESNQDVNHGEKVELSAKLSADDVTVDGEKITFEAEEEMVFRCGKSSITLTKSGKILIRGKYLLNRASGVNRIMGGSVQVN